jgi:hypothetical protein
MIQSIVEQNDITFKFYMFNLLFYFFMNLDYNSGESPPGLHLDDVEQRVYRQLKQYCFLTFIHSYEFIYSFFKFEYLNY